MSMFLEWDSSVTAWGYYLAGGTALALHLGHRRSLDLDWFTSRSVGDPLGLAKRLREEKLPFRTKQTARGTLHGMIAGVRVSLLEYRYGLLRPLLDAPKFGCVLASLEDLAAVKLAALAQRGAKKDFVDLYALGRNGCRSCSPAAIGARSRRQFRNGYLRFRGDLHSAGYPGCLAVCNSYAEDFFASLQNLRTIQRLLALTAFWQLVKGRHALTTIFAHGRLEGARAARNMRRGQMRYPSWVGLRAFSERGKRG